MLFFKNYIVLHAHMLKAIVSYDHYLELHANNNYSLSSYSHAPPNIGHWIVSPLTDAHLTLNMYYIIEH